MFAMSKPEGIGWVP